MQNKFVKKMNGIFGFTVYIYALKVATYIIKIVQYSPQVENRYQQISISPFLEFPFDNYDIIDNQLQWFEIVEHRQFAWLFDN